MVPTRVIKPKSVDELFAEFFDLPPQFLFRGVSRSSYELQCSLARVADAQSPLGDIEDDALGEFKALSRRWLRDPPDDDDMLGWFAVMQHYGAPTRLLDWTASPFIGLFFALRTQGDETAAVWTLNRSSATKHHNVASVRRDSARPWGSDSRLPGDESEISQDDRAARTKSASSAVRGRRNRFEKARMRCDAIPWILELERPDERMVAQQGVLTYVNTLDGVIPKNVTREGKGGRRFRLLRKYELDPSLRTESLRRLGRMGLSYATLFPGLDGIGEAVRERLDLEKTMLAELHEDDE